MAHKQTGEPPGLWRFWRWWLPPAIISLALILFFVDPFIGDWDAFDYTLSSLRGFPSSMALGRSLFIFYNRALYLVAHALFNLPARNAYLLFKYAVVAQGPLAVIACWTLTRAVSRSLPAATIAAFLVAFSPVFIIYGGQVMTDIPALLLVTVALIVHLRGLRQKRVWPVIIGAALLGAGVNLRETVGLYGLWLVYGPLVCGWGRGRREFLLIALSCAVFLSFALGGFGYFFLTDPGYRQAWFGWRESMRLESARHPATVGNVIPWLIYFFATAPLVLLSLPMAFANEWRRQGLSILLLLAAVGLGADLLLLFNYSTAIGWRYLLTGLPALAPLSADYLTGSLTTRLGTERRALIWGAAAIISIAVACGVYLWPVRSEFTKLRTAARDYDAQLMKLPRDSVLIAGAQTVTVVYWRGLGEGEWDVIPSGSGWPGSQLIPVIDDYLKRGRRVFVDADPRWWQPCGWHVPEITELVGIESRFRFRRVALTIYEIRPADEVTASDQPGLNTLLPKNRVGELKRCFNTG